MRVNGHVPTILHTAAECQAGRAHQQRRHVREWRNPATARGGDGVRWRRADAAGLDESVKAVASIAETGNDVAELVELLVEGAEHDRDVTTSVHGLLDRSEAFWGGD